MSNCDDTRDAGSSGFGAHSRREGAPIDSDEELDDLPPLDGDGEEYDEAEVELDDVGIDDGMPLDDATGGDASAEADEEIDVNEADCSWVGEAPDAPDLDLGDAGLVDFSEERDSDDGGEEPVGPVEEVGFGREPGDREALDSGDEGPLGPDEELRDEDLPALDEDDEPDAEEASFWDASRLLSEEPAGLSWAAEPWTRVGAPLALAHARAVTCVPRGALVAGGGDAAAGDREAAHDPARARLIRVDLEGALEALSAEGVGAVDVRALAADGASVAVVTDEGRLYVSTDAGGRFRPAPEGLPIVDAVIFSTGLVWVRTRAGALFVSDDGGLAFARRPLPGVVAALARDGDSGVVALVVGDDSRPVALVRGTRDGGTSTEVLAAPAARLPALLAARRGAIAFATPDGVVRRERDGAWRSFAWDGRITAMAFMDDAGTLVAASYAEAEDTTGLVRLDPGGKVSLVARVGTSSSSHAGAREASDGRVLAIACDDSRGVVWLAGGFGVAAFSHSETN